MRTLIESGWGQETPAFRQMFTSLFIPEGTPEQIAWFNELERITTSTENAVRIYDLVATVDVSELLPQVTVPTLVMHNNGDAAITYAAGRKMASMIPNAKFVTLESRNHLILEHEPAFARFLSEINDFLDAA
jgi:pimeloyl-ACP methyl ester carboxylesterase